MERGKWESFGSYFRVYSSEAYADTLRAVETLAGSSLALLENKTQEERNAIFAKAQSLTEKVYDAVEMEPPLVVALALMTALRTHEHFIQQQAEQNKQQRSK